MINSKKMLAAASAVLLTFSFTACKNKKNDSSESVGSIPEESSQAESPAENKTLVWLSDYDINPQPNEKPSAALALFKERYGSEIQYIHVDSRDKYTVLGMKLQADEQVDIFPYDAETIPNQALNNYFSPLDEYSDILEADTPMWDDMRDVIEALKYKGGHYVMPYSVSSPDMLIYSKTALSALSLPDPYELYKRGDWTWSKFKELMVSYVEANGGYGVCGNFGQGMLNSTGEPIVKNSDGVFSNNMSSPAIEKAELFIQEIASQKLWNPDETWTYYKNDKNTLFFAESDWALAESNLKSEEDELMIVPFPKMDDADSYSSGYNVNAVMLVAGSELGEAAAAYIKCEREVQTTPEYQAILKEKATSEQKIATGAVVGYIKPEQYDALQEFLNPSVIKPVIDTGYGMGSRMFGTDTYSYETRGILNNLNDAFLKYPANAESWEVMLATWQGIADVEISNFNR